MLKNLFAKVPWKQAALAAAAAAAGYYGGPAAKNAALEWLPKLWGAITGS